MTNPLKLRKNANGVYTDGLQVMSDTELKYAASIVLAKFGSTTQGAGDIIFDTDIGDSIGTFVDQYANGELSSHPANTTLLSTTYTLYQNTSAASETSMTIPAKLDTASFVKPLSDTDLNDSIIQTCLDKIAAANSTFGEAGTYYVASNTSLLPSGTWSAVSTIYDEVTNHPNDDDEKVTYSLYRRTNVSDSGDSADVPITIDSATPSHLKEMTTAQLQSLAERLRNRIIATGIGTYALQQAAPSTGTWVSRGTITDRVPTINNVTYSRGDQYTRVFSAQYTRDSIGYGRSYTLLPLVPPEYLRAVYGTGAYTSVRYQRQYSGSYARIVIGAAYSPVTTATYNGQRDHSYTSPNYTGSALNTSEQQALSLYSAGNTVTGTRQYGRNLSYIRGQFTSTYIRTTVNAGGPTYTRASFARIVTSSQYTSAVNTYRVDTFQRQFTRQFAGNYTRIITGPKYTRALYNRAYGGENYAAQYFRFYAIQYFSQYIRAVVGPDYQRSDVYNRNRIGPTYFQQYQRVYSAGYTAAAVDKQFTRNVWYGTLYSVQYTGGYARGFSVQYTRGNYLRGTIDNYASPEQYLRELDPSDPLSGAQYYVNYARNRFAGTYSPSSTYATYSVEPYEFYSRATYYRFFIRGVYDRVQYNRGNFYRQYTGTYQSPTRTSYVPGPQYTRDSGFTRIYNAGYNRGFTRIYSANYLRGNAFSNPIYMRGTVPGATGFSARGNAGLILGPQYSGPSFQRFYTRADTYARQYTRIYSANYDRLTTGPKYNGPKYTTVYMSSFSAQYTRTFSGNYNQVYAQQYSRVFSGNYDRLVTGPQYASDTANYNRGYSAQYTRATIGLQYTREFTGNTVRPANEVAFTEVSTTLWLRVA